MRTQLTIIPNPQSKSQYQGTMNTSDHRSVSFLIEQQGNEIICHLNRYNFAHKGLKHVADSFAKAVFKNRKNPFWRNGYNNELHCSESYRTFIKKDNQSILETIHPFESEIQIIENEVIKQGNC